jgi:hypothetical protein
MEPTMSVKAAYPTPTTGFISRAGNEKRYVYENIGFWDNSVVV